MLLTSIFECDPIIMYEAFASRTPLVATPVGSVPEFGEYVKIVKSMAEMYNEAINLLNNQEERTALAERAYQLWSRQHSLERVVDRYEELYKRLCYST